jgi:hypothetical protein
MAQDATTNEFAIANYEELCELKLFWGLLVWCLCWKLCKVWAIMFRINKPSFTTFWPMWSYIKLTYTKCIVF